MSAEVVHVERLVEAPDQWTLALSRELPLFSSMSPTATAPKSTSPLLGAEAPRDDDENAHARLDRHDPALVLHHAAAANQPAWYWTVVGASALGCLLAALGLDPRGHAISEVDTVLVVGLVDSLPRRMRWHYILGAFFGVFALTWVFSGLLSMEPFDWSNAEGVEIGAERADGRARRPRALPRFRRAALARAARRPHAQRDRAAAHPGRAFLPRALHRRPPAAAARASACISRTTSAAAARSSRARRRRTATIRTEPFSTESLVARIAGRVRRRAPIVAQDLLADYDSYYYSRGRQAPLPVLRLKLADPLETWVYVDPALGEVLATVHRLQRLERWLYNGLHSLDFGFWYDRRPLWDIGMIVLLLGGLTSSSLASIWGIRRLLRSATPVRINS